jgi:hypothetical protein
MHFRTERVVEEAGKLHEARHMNKGKAAFPLAISSYRASISVRM